MLLGVPNTGGGHGSYQDRFTVSRLMQDMFGSTPCLAADGKQEGEESTKFPAWQAQRQSAQSGTVPH